MGFQDLVVGLIVLGAAAWLTRRWWRRRKRAACACDGCPVAEKLERSAPAPLASSGLLTIESPSTRVSDRM